METITEEVIKKHIKEGDNEPRPEIATERYLRAIAKGIEFLVKSEIQKESKK